MRSVASARRCSRFVVDDADRTVRRHVHAINDAAQVWAVVQRGLKPELARRRLKTFGVLKDKIRTQPSPRVVKKLVTLSRVLHQSGEFWLLLHHRIPRRRQHVPAGGGGALRCGKIEEVLQHGVNQRSERGGTRRGLGNSVNRPQPKHERTLCEVIRAGWGQAGWCGHAASLGESTDSARSDYREAMPQQRTRGLVIGRLLGAPVIVQPSTLLMLALLSYLFASAAGETTKRTLSIGFILAVSLVASVFLHEVAHAIAARAFGRRVTEIVLTLWGGHTSFESKNLTPVVNGVTAAAGPLMNLLIALAARGVLLLADPSGLTGVLISYIAWANVLLAVFNVLPGIPMDGGRILESLVWRLSGNRNRGMHVAAWGGRVVAVGVVAYALGTPIARGQNPSYVDVFAGVLVFSILWPSASAALRYSKVMMKRDVLSVATVMRPAVAVAYTVTVADAREAAAGVTDVVVLGADGAPAGRFEVAATDVVPEALRSTTPLQAVTVPLPRGAHVDADATADVLLAHVRQWWGKTDALVALRADAVAGIVRLADVTAALE